MEPPLPSLQEFVSLAYSLETSVSIEIFIDFLGKRAREGYTDCTKLFHGRIDRFPRAIRIVFDMEILVE